MENSPEEYDFGGWATKFDKLCADGRTILKGAFSEQNGTRVPLVWSHKHDSIAQVLGHADLEERPEGVYAHCKLNNSENGKNAREVLKNGDIAALSIWANNLRHVNGRNVAHGVIKEVSLVLAGANPGAFIDSVMVHSDEEWIADEATIYNDDDDIALYHSADMDNSEEGEKKMEEKKDESKEEKKDDKTISDVLKTLNDEQQLAVQFVIGTAIEDAKNESEPEEGGKEEMKHNAFDRTDDRENVLSHSDEMEILNLAKSNSVGSLQEAISLYMEESDSLHHGIDDIETLFPEYKDIRPGAPEFIERDQTWVAGVINGVKKSPYARIRTRQADITGTDLRALGYKKGAKKVNGGNIKLLKRTTDPQTVYRKDVLNRDDILDITDFSVVDFQYHVMRQNLNEELATAILIGDGRDDGDDYKISHEHIRPIWLDDELYTIHADLDLEGAKAELQGSNTSGYFGDNYIYAEAVIQASLYAREEYKGSGSLTYYCTPHSLNRMLLARDMNGRRIFSSKAELEAALNVSKIETVEQFEKKTRTTEDAKTKELVGLFVNLTDYTCGSTKGGEITKFNQFDIDFNQEKYLIETRLSGALTRVKSAIAIEEDVTSVAP